MKYLVAIAALASLSAAPAAVAAPVEYVKICANGYYYNPGTSACVDATAGVKAEEGVAVSLALPGTTVDPGKTFGASVHLGTFNGQSAIGIGGAFRANSNVTFDGGVGIGINQQTVGARAGANVSW